MCVIVLFKMANTTELQQIIEKQSKFNVTTYKRLQELGLKKDTKVELDFFYFAPNKPQAEKLKQLLILQEYKVTVQSEGNIFKRKWFVTGTTKPTIITLEKLHDWTTWMAKEGYKVECIFDGWGTSL